jgi:hypothetical protein
VEEDDVYGGCGCLFLLLFFWPLVLWLLKVIFVAFASIIYAVVIIVPFLIVPASIFYISTKNLHSQLNHKEIRPIKAISLVVLNILFGISLGSYSMAEEIGLTNEVILAFSLTSAYFSGSLLLLLLSYPPLKRWNDVRKYRKSEINLIKP